MKRGTWSYVEPQPNAMVHHFPLRKNYTAQFVLPRDLTTAEAKRIAAMLQAIAAPSGDDHGAER